MLKAIIIDDEERGRISLREKIKTYCPLLQIVGEAANAKEGMAQIEQQQPDVVFLDIQMPRLSGFEMLNKIPQHDFHIVFTTAYDQYAIKAIKYAAFDYLLKPIDVEELKDVVSKLSSRVAQQQTEQMEILNQNLGVTGKLPGKIALSTTEGLLFYNLADIVYLKASSSYTIMYLLNRTNVLVTKTLKEFEELLPKDIFFRSHHSYLINLNHIRKYIRGDGGQIVLVNGDSVDLSRRKKEEFLRILL